MSKQYGRVRALRLARGKSLAGLSSETGISVSTLVRVEHGRARVYQPTLEKLAEYFGVPVAELEGTPVKDRRRVERTSAYRRGYNQAVREVREWAKAHAYEGAYGVCFVGDDLLAKLDEMERG